MLEMASAYGLRPRLWLLIKYKGVPPPPGFNQTKYRRHTDLNDRNDQKEMKRYKGLNYFKQNCPIFRFAIQTFLKRLSGKKICGKKTVTNKNLNKNTRQ